MKARLSGRDPYFPKHPDELSSPQMLFIEIWGAADRRTRQGVERAATELLKGLVSHEGELSGAKRDYAMSLLRLLVGIRPFGARGFLEGLIRGKGYRKKAFLKAGLDRFLVAAYTAQGENADEELLLKLLTRKSYAVDAFWGLSLLKREKSAENLPALLSHFRNEPKASVLSALFLRLDNSFKDSNRPGMEVLLSHSRGLPGWAVNTAAASMNMVGISMSPVSQTGKARTRRFRREDLARIKKIVEEAYDGAVQLPAPRQRGIESWCGQAA